MVLLLVFSNYVCEFSGSDSSLIIQQTIRHCSLLLWDGLRCLNDSISGSGGKNIQDTLCSKWKWKKRVKIMAYINGHSEHIFFKSKSGTSNFGKKTNSALNWYYQLIMHVKNYLVLSIIVIVLNIIYLVLSI